MAEDPGKRAIVFGASGGIGGAVTAQLRQSGDYEVLAGSRSGSGDFHFDLTDESSIARSAQQVGSGKPIDFVFIATGLLHRDDGISPEKSWRALDATNMSEVFAVNAVGPTLVAKHFLPLLRRDRRAVFAALSARVGSIADNRLGGWHSYRASKAALNMILRNLAVELGRTHPQAVVAGLHPGTVDTGLSAPFQKGVKPERLFTADHSAERLLAVVEGLTPADSGGVFAWDGARIPE